MTIFFSWFLLSIVVGVLADRRGRSGVGWTFLAFAISPLIAGAFVLALRDRSLGHELLVLEKMLTQCQHCSQLTRRDLSVCLHCCRDHSAPTTAVITTSQTKIAAAEPPKYSHDDQSDVPETYRPCAAALPAEFRSKLKVVATSEHQKELEIIVGGRQEDSAYFSTSAFLIPEAQKGLDYVPVRVEIGRRRVGYLSQPAAESFIHALWQTDFVTGRCDATIVGGWHRDGQEDGLFGVRLDALHPFAFENVPPPKSADEISKSDARWIIAAVGGVATLVIFAGAAAVLYGQRLNLIGIQAEAETSDSTQSLPLTQPIWLQPPAPPPIPRPRPPQAPAR